MRPLPPPIDRGREERLAFVAAVAMVLIAWGAVRLAETRRGLGLVLLGLALAMLRLILPNVASALARPFLYVSRRVGEVMGTILLTIFYVVLVVPYAFVLRALGVVASDKEPWPPASSSSWGPVDVAAGGGVRSRGVAGSFVARALHRAGDGVALVRYFARRPALFLLPLVVLVLALAAFVLLGNATGLGPLIYTLF